MPLLADRVLESTTTTGTGTFALGGALTGYRTFNSSFSNGDVVYYTADNGSGEWEVGYGTVGTGTLTRNVIESSNANALVTFSAGVKRLFCTAPAASILNASTGGTVSGPLTVTSTTTLATSLSGLLKASSGVVSTASAGTDYVAVGGALGTPSSGTLTSCTGLPLTTGVTGTLPVGNGGTGTTSLTANNVLLGNGTGALQVVAPGTAGNVLTSNGTTWTSAAAGASLLGRTNSSYPSITTLGYGISSSGYSNTAVGYTACSAITSGSNNAALGSYALRLITTGAYNVAIGDVALSSSTTGSTNIAMGYAALVSNTTGSNHVAIGYFALYNDVTTGQGRNTALGYSAGYANTTGTNNSFIGGQADGASPTASNAITLGNSSITTLRCQVTTITALSDARDKTDIAELDAGLDFVNALAPVSFTWNMRDGGKVDEPDTGFIAQELVKAQEDTGHYIPGLVYDENPERLEAGYGKLIPVLVKAIQELSAEVSALKSQLNGANNG